MYSFIKQHISLTLQYFLNCNHMHWRIRSVHPMVAMTTICTVVAWVWSSNVLYYGLEPIEVVTTTHKNWYHIVTDYSWKECYNFIAQTSDECMRSSHRNEHRCFRYVIRGWPTCEGEEKGEELSYLLLSEQSINWEISNDSGNFKWVWFLLMDPSDSHIVRKRWIPRHFGARPINIVLVKFLFSFLKLVFEQWVHSTLVTISEDM